ncbi:hypothetical protein [Nocardia lijiangensis]|nr:hypothetical protein [Nocardia lijiangensis]
MAELTTADLFDAAAKWWRADHGDGGGEVVRAIGSMVAGFRV